MSISTRPLTYDDLIQMPDDGNRYELIGGELIVCPSPATVHQELVARLFVLLWTYVTTRGLGKVYSAPYDVRLSPHDVVQPDILFVSQARRPIIGKNFADGAPDLLVEVLSPSTRSLDEGRKMRLYAASGVLEYWLVDPEEQWLRLFVLRNGRYDQVERETEILRSTAVPGLEIDLKDLFADLDVA